RRGPFTHDPRSVRTREIDQKHLRLELKFDLDKQTFDGRAIHQLAMFKDQSTVKLDAADMKIKKVALRNTPPREGDSPLKFESKAHSLTIELDRQYKAGESLELVIDYQVTKPAHGVHFVAPDPDEPNQPKMAWTQGEPEFARYWYPCFDSS